MRTALRVLLSVSISASLGLPASAQGADDCSAASPIAGTGTFAISTIGSTDSPQQTGACSTIHHDVWFLWTAPATQSMQLSTCNGTFADTVVAVYPGASCPSSGSQLACNDDACGQQSQVYFNAVAGQSYLIQIGDWDPNATFSGSFSLAPGTSQCNVSTGPDVIVGEIVGIQNSNPFNGLDSFSLGTTACNAGNALINWVGPTNQHPVIGETFYKFKTVAGSGRFEQIGMSWLKHGFASDTTSVCCTCQPPADNQHMGVGCSDTYSAGQAGAQGSLAPRWQVDANTGVFPYPGANPTWSGSTARRCESLLSELEPSSATVKYFAECTYTTADDAQAGNGNNNASYAGIDVTGNAVNYTFAINAATHRMENAIRAWAMLESGVHITPVQIPGEGLFLVGAKATDLGAGLYHYEYAVHNMNSKLAGGSFAVPVPPGATITNIGFHDITYRNGDGLNGVNQTATDWPAQVSGGAITWNCETPAQNLNANAIRWATTYNFRFDANVPPVDGSALLGVWNVASPTAFAFATSIPGGNGALFAFCSGDGVTGACPCANTGLAGRGCQNSAATGGALLQASGVPSLAGDTLLFSASGELASALSIVLQGDVALAATNFGDGLRCAGGSLKRLYVHSAVGGALNAPSGADLGISARSAQLGDAIPLGGTRVYQVYYRDPNAGFCAAPQGGTFNVSGAISATWGP
ncbi:MAG: hypothetical protein IPJ19_02425 [Planctomycetes bacterium]|nr:hypothetical protein [Planctomycetota bacterium]